MIRYSFDAGVLICRPRFPTLTCPRFAIPKLRTRSSKPRRPCQTLPGSASARIRLSAKSAAAAWAPSSWPEGSGARAAGGHAESARLPCTCVELRRRCSCSSPSTPASRSPGARAVAARPSATTKGALARKTRSSFAANRGSAAREAAFRIEPRAPVCPAQHRGGERAERAVGGSIARAAGRSRPSARLLCTFELARAVASERY